MVGLKQSILGFLDRGAESLKAIIFKGGLLHIVLLFCMACFVWPISHLDEFKDFARNRLSWDVRLDIAITTAVVFGLLVAISATVILIRRKSSNDLYDSIRLLNDSLLWALALPFILVAGVPALERKHGILSLFVMSVATVICGVWMYRWLGRLRHKRVGSESPEHLGDEPDTDENVQQVATAIAVADPDLLVAELKSAEPSDVNEATESGSSMVDAVETDDGGGGLIEGTNLTAPQVDGRGPVSEKAIQPTPADDREGTGDVWDPSIQSVSQNAVPLNVESPVTLEEGQKSSQSASRWPAFAAWSALIAMAAAFAHHFSTLAINNHHSFRSQMADLGYYDNIFYQSINGNPLGCTFLLGEVHYSSHFDPLLVLISPLYLLYPQAEGILIIQSVWLALGSIPMYLITQHCLGKRWLSVLMGALLLTYAPLHGPALYDFHSLTLLGPLALWLMYAIQRRSWPWFYVFLVLCLLTREDISFVMFLVGVSILFSCHGTDRKHGWFTIATAVSYFVFVKTSVMISSDLLNCSEGGTCFGSMFKDLAPAKKGSGEILLSLWTSPSHALAHMLNEKKIIYFVQLFLPLCFVPLLAPRGRLIMLFGVAVIALGTKFALFSIGFQYSTWIYPFAFAITPLALKHLQTGGHPWVRLDRRRLVPALVTAMVVGSILMTWRYGAFVKNDAFRGGFGRVTYEIKDSHIKRLEWLREATKKIPLEARLGVTRHMAPHVSNRPFVYPFPTWGRKGKPGPEYLLVRMRDIRKKARNLQKDIRDGYYKVIAKKSDIYILKVTDWTKVKPKKKKKKKRKTKKRRRKSSKLKKSKLIEAGLIGPQKRVLKRLKKNKGAQKSKKTKRRKNAKKKARSKKKASSIRGKKNRKQKTSASRKKSKRKKKRAKKRRRGPRVR